MDEIGVAEVLEKYPYLKKEGIQVESCMTNDRTFCVLLNVRMKDLIEIVDSHGWDCVFDRGVPEDQSVFTCIARIV